MRASRLMQLAVRLQVRGGASAATLASELGVSVRTVYRDVEALSASGVPVWAEPGRTGGIRIDPAYRIAGLPRLDGDRARSVLFAAVPAIAAQLGFAEDAGAAVLFPAMAAADQRAAEVVRDRLLVEPSHWFAPGVASMVLTDLADAVWNARSITVSYRGTVLSFEPLGLILKGDKWYVLGRAPISPAGEFRLLRLDRIDGDVRHRDHFDRPRDFDLARAWRQLQASFLASLPECHVTVRVSPAGEALLPMLEEGAPALPLPADVRRDSDGWAVIRLRFERRLPGAARQLLRLGAQVEVVEPAAIRAEMARTAIELAGLYSSDPVGIQ